MTKKPFRLAIINTHPIQYFAPLYRYINSDSDFDITVLYLTDFSLRGAEDPGFGRKVTWDVDLLGGYNSVFVGGERVKKRTPRGFFSLICPEIWTHVRGGKYDALLIHGHNYLANLIGLCAARTCNIPVLIRGDTHLGKSRSPLKLVARSIVMPAFYRLIDFVLATGTRNTDYYRAMGVDERKLVFLPFSIDNERFGAQSNLSAEAKASERRKYDIPADRPAILFAAKLVGQKRPLDLLEAARKVAKKTSAPFQVVMCGSGELEATLRDYCIQHHLTNVTFTGFVNQAELPRLYGACDVFVLPADNEAWGLAVNEAMCARLPVVVSQEVGCVPDLVEDGVNGFAPRAGDVDGLADALTCLVEDEALRKRLGEASARRISTWSYRECLENLRAARFATAAIIEA